MRERQSPCDEGVGCGRLAGGGWGVVR